LNLPVKKPVGKKNLADKKGPMRAPPPSQVINDFDEQPVGVSRPNNFDE
jgi:hypothetical protein